MANWTDEDGLLDFVPLGDLQSLLLHLRRLGEWPVNMPLSLKQQKED